MRESGRRKSERYAVALPARLSVLTREDAAPENPRWELKTKNISSNGAFFVTDRLFHEGTLLAIDLDLPFSKREGDVMKKAGVHVRGEVVRVEQNGIAVRFLKAYHFT